MNFKIIAIENEFNHLFNLNEDELRSKDIVKMVVDEKPGYPCRVTLEDAEIGEEIILFSFQHHKSDSPYQSSGPIFIRKNAVTPDLDVNEVPKMLLHRFLSLRMYDVKGMMIDAITIEGKKLKNEIKVILKNTLVDYIQIHNSSPGCYNCQVNRK